MIGVFEQVRKNEVRGWIWMKNSSFKKESSPNLSFIFIVSKERETGTVHFLWEQSSVFWSVLANISKPYAFSSWKRSWEWGLAVADDCQIQGKALLEGMLEEI